jgi:hypothetical protein
LTIVLTLIWGSSTLTRIQVTVFVDL